MRWKRAETNGTARKLEHHNDGGKESASCEILRRFSYDFPLLPLRRSGCGAFLFDFYRLGQRVTGRCGEGDPDDSPLTGLAGEADVAVVILHGVLHDGEAQPRAAGGLEWLLSTR